MRWFKYIATIFSFTLLTLFSGCNTSDTTSPKAHVGDKRVCPQCNMELSKSNVDTAVIEDDGKLYYFDDIGCMILWSSENKINLKESKVEVYSKDTAKYIDSYSANYTFNEKTPMSYGFRAYEKTKENSIDFNELRVRMLRGENMANPKIRKQILGL